MYIEGSGYVFCLILNCISLVFDRILVLMYAFPWISRAPSTTIRVFGVDPHFVESFCEREGASEQ
jgi:hypothetical protein